MRVDLFRVALLRTVLFDVEARRLPNASVENDRDKRISRITTKRGVTNKRGERVLTTWISCFMQSLYLSWELMLTSAMSLAKSTKALRLINFKPTEHPSS